MKKRTLKERALDSVLEEADHLAVAVLIDALGSANIRARRYIKAREAYRAATRDRRRRGK